MPMVLILAMYEPWQPLNHHADASTIGPLTVLYSWEGKKLWERHTTA